MRTQKRFTALALLLALVLLTALAGCSSYANGGENVKGKDSYNNIDEETGTDVTGGRKIIKSYDDHITTRDFEGTLKKLAEALTECGGYVESADIANIGRSPSAVLVYRVPADKSERFKALVSGSGDLARQTERTEDVTGEYIDTEARLKVLTESRDAITAMLADAKTVAELLELRQRLDSLNIEIESLTSSLHKWDSLVEMSRYTVRVETVEENAIISETPYVTQITGALIGGFKGFGFIMGRILLAVLYLLPYLITAGIVLAVVLIIRKRRRRGPRQ